MKIEKLTEDKIRVIVNSNELKINTNNCDSSSIMSQAMESNDFFLNILKKAEKEVNFYTDGHKLLIELFPSFDDSFIFTITKYIPNNEIRKKVTIKKKCFNKIKKHAICCFDNFDVFCDFCYAIKFLHKIDSNNLIDNSCLYLWNNNYYLVLKNTNAKSTNSFLFYSMLSEFTRAISFSNTFEAKLKEHGEIIIDNNAIEVGINFFAK